MQFTIFVSKIMLIYGLVYLLISVEYIFLSLTGVVSTSLLHNILPVIVKIVKEQYGYKLDCY
jgi:hypothetical protein